MRKAARLIMNVVLVAGLIAAVSDPGQARDRRVARYGGKDMRTAEQLRPMADRGGAKAQTQLGFLYATGRGVPQDQIEAVVWYIRAAAQGEPNAQYLLGLAYDKGHGIRRDSVLAYMWLNLATARADRRSRQYYAKIRDAVASKLTATQLDHGQRLANQWQPYSQH